MPNPPASSQQPAATTRRDFVKSTAALSAGLALGVAPRAYAGSDETLRVGLIGCGGRGTGAAAQALRADKNTKLVAMGDAFPDAIERSLSALKGTDVADRVEITPDRCFSGFDNYKHVIASDVDVVLLCSPPHFRPEHFRAAVEANKHVFAEKPVAVDAPGVRSVLATAAEAKKRNLAVVSGLCWRYETGMQEMIGKIHDGAIGDIVALESTRYNGGVKVTARQPEWTEMEYQVRNWYYFTWLSGDFNVEQFVHELDKMAWVMQDEPPVSCSATGGRQQRTGEEYGHIYDHISAVYEYANGVKYFASTRHQRGCSNPFHDHVLGTKGHADLMKYTISGANPWRRRERRTVMHQLEHDAMYAALRKGEIINNGEYMAKSTLMGIMARMSAYTGQTLTWDQVMNSQEDLTPVAYDWNAQLPEWPVAMPGVTQFV